MQDLKQNTLENNNTNTQNWIYHKHQIQNISTWPCRAKLKKDKQFSITKTNITKTLCDWGRQKKNWNTSLKSRRRRRKKLDSHTPSLVYVLEWRVMRREVTGRARREKEGEREREKEGRDTKHKGERTRSECGRWGKNKLHNNYNELPDPTDTNTPSKHALKPCRST